MPLNKAMILKNVSKAISPWVFKAAGIDIFKWKKWLEKASKWPEEKRTNWKLLKLNEIIKHCWDNVPFYGDFWSTNGMKWQRIKCFEEISEYPIVTRELLKDNRDDFIPKNLKEIPHKSDSTGGTTGAPLKYYHDLELHALRYGYQLIGWGYAGYEFGDDVSIISGGALLPGKKTFRNTIRAWLERKHGWPCLHMDEREAKNIYQLIEKKRAKFIYGYPSMITLFLEKSKDLGLSVAWVRSIITTSEMNYPHYRRRIEKLSNAKVFDHFGCNDGGLLSYECIKHKGYHYNDFESILETIEKDDNGKGLLIITNLWNKSMPFVRYQNDDLVIIGSNSCDCGSGFPIINSVEGRSGDILRFANGRSMTGPGLTLIFKDFDIQAFQIAQIGKMELEVRIISRSHLPQKHKKHILDILHYHLTSDVKIAIKYVEKLSLTSRSKLKPVVKEMDEEFKRK